MDKLDIVKKLLAKIKMPNSQQSPLCCYTLLALARLKQETSWHEATNEWTRIHDIIVFTSENYSFGRFTYYLTTEYIAHS